jgi:hypothetical protein
VDTLLFIYNAEDGLANALVDTGRRIFRPEAYPCALCMITYGPFGMKKDWKRFAGSIPYEVKFLHKNELPPILQHANLDFPSLVTVSNDSYRILINASSFSQLKDLASLKREVTKALSIKA